MAKHGKYMPEPFTGGIEKHGITKYKQTPEPYFGPYEIIGGTGLWPIGDKHIDDSPVTPDQVKRGGGGNP